MSGSIEIRKIEPSEYHHLSVMVGELLDEISERIGNQVFSFDLEETEERAEKLISENKYWVFVAEDAASKIVVGFVSLYESYALYSEGAYGTMPELYVKEGWRSKSVGSRLLGEVMKFAHEKG